jgi:hypothetical protein
MSHHQSHAYQSFYGFRISYRNQDAFLFLTFAALHQIFLGHHFACGTLCHNRTYNTSEQNHDHRTIQNIIIQQPLSIFHNNTVTYQHSGQSRSSLCIA